MRNVPFFANTSDDTHCFQASLKMVLKYFEPGREFSWNELDRITNKPDGKWTWPMAGLTWLANNSYEVTNIEAFNYDNFIRGGETYMRELWGEEVVAVQAENSDISKAQEDAKSFVRAVKIDERIPDINEVKRFISNGFLVICNLNAAKLNQKEGFIGHFVLVYDFNDDEDTFSMHDPGLPPLEGRTISTNKFFEAWADPNEKAKNIMAIKLKD